MYTRFQFAPLGKKTKTTHFCVPTTWRSRALLSVPGDGSAPCLRVTGLSPAELCHVSGSSFEDARVRVSIGQLPREDELPACKAAGPAGMREGRTSGPSCPGSGARRPPGGVLLVLHLLGWVLVGGKRTSFKALTPLVTSRGGGSASGPFPERWEVWARTEKQMVLLA